MRRIERIGGFWRKITLLEFKNLGEVEANSVVVFGNS
jgi:hypothetical protein